MDSATQGITPLRQRMIDDMRMRQFADKTQSYYIRAGRQLAAFLGRSPDTATVDDLRRYQLQLVDHGTSPVSLNAAIAGLKFFFEVTLGDGDLMAKMQPGAGQDARGWLAVSGSQPHRVVVHSPLEHTVGAKRRPMGRAARSLTGHVQTVEVAARSSSKR